MRRPVQCEGIERGPERVVQIGIVAAVQPQLVLNPLAEALGRPRPPGINPWANFHYYA